MTMGKGAGKGGAADSAPGCSHCGYEIEENTPFIIDKDGYNYHPECFRCVRCNDIIPDSQYKPTKDGPVCLTCGLPQCGECMNLIVGDLIVATHVDGTPYSFHTQCLKCVQCGLSITDKYKATEDGFKCTNCESPVCTSCGKVIPGGSQYYLDQETYASQCANCYRQRQASRLKAPQVMGGGATTISSPIGGGGMGGVQMVQNGAPLMAGDFAQGPRFVNTNGAQFHVQQPPRVVYRQ